MPDHSIAHTSVTRMVADAVTTADDVLAVEEPLEIRLEYNDGHKRQTKSISVTMRTPGNDTELAEGFLYTEGIVGSADHIVATTVVRENVVMVSLNGDRRPSLVNIERNFYTTSSCGVCGKASIEAVHAVCPVLDTKDSLRISREILYALPYTLRETQEVFASTGGLHGCALFDMQGELLLSREDVGRHNAVDKLIGAALVQDLLPLNEHALLLSGRASFELVQKAAMAGIKIIAAVGAPSSLAVRMAEDWGMTLVGFLRGERCNIYTGAQRVVI
jgi:FdhD protein